MARKPFQLTIVTPEKTVYEGEVTSLTLPAVDGYLGIWANHAPMVAALTPGVLTLLEKDEHSAPLYAVGAGFAEVSDNKVILLVDSATHQGEIDLDEAKARFDEFKEQVEAARKASTDQAAIAELEAKMAEEKARMDAGFRTGAR